MASAMSSSAMLGWPARQQHASTVAQSPYAPLGSAPLPVLPCPPSADLIDDRLLISGFEQLCPPNPPQSGLFPCPGQRRVPE